MTVRTKTKKKLCYFILMLAVILLFSACGDSSDDIEPQKTTAAKLAEAQSALTLTVEPVETMVLLPSAGLYNSSIIWTSSNPSVIGNDGIVVARPVNDLNVKFTAEISLAAETVVKEFDVTVKERDKSLYKAGFSDGNDDIFFGDDIVENESTIIVKDTGFTRFGEYRKTWNGGFVAGVEMFLDPDAFETGEYFTWTVALSNTSGEYLTEKYVDFRKTVHGLKVSTAGINSCEECNLSSVESETASIISYAGFYTIVVKYYEENGFIMVDCEVVKSSDNSVIHSQTYEMSYYVASEGNVRMPVGLAGGNRYGWFSLMEAVTGVEIKSVWLGKV